MGKIPSLDDLEQSVSAAPDNYDLRRRYIERLLEEGEGSRASEHLDILVGALGDVAWVLSLGMQVATANGDHLQAARFRKRLRECLERDLDEDDDDDDEEDETWPPAPHPSRPVAAAGGAGGGWPPGPPDSTGPRLRLLTGGGDEHDLHDGPADLPRSLEQLSGMATVKRNLSEIIERVRSTDVPSNGPWLGGVLFYGPPSCGKAFAGRVVAAELDAAMWSFDMAVAWPGRTLHDMVERALQSGGDRIAVLYFENLDMPAARSAMRAVVPLLDESRHAKAVVLGAATLPWLVSTEIVRAGRMGRVLLVLPPDGPARHDYLVEHFAGRAMVSHDEIDWLVEHTEGHSFGDLAQLVETALELANGSAPPIALPHTAIRQARHRVSATSAEWLTAAGHHAMMNEGGGLYDDLLAYFRHRIRI